MARKGQKKLSTTQSLTPEKYLRQRVRSLEIGECYATDMFNDGGGEGVVIVSRKHSGGKYSMCAYLIDAFCLGIKNSTYNMWIEDYEFRDIIRQYEGLKQCSYEEAHNMVYGAMEFALEAGIVPHSSFALTQYMLEEDDDRIPIIDYPFGKDGKHFLVADNMQQANRYLPLLRRNLGEGNYDYILTDEETMHTPYREADGNAFSAPINTTMMENLSNYNKADILDLAGMLDLDLPENEDEEQAKEAYIQAVIGNPVHVLKRLPKIEIIQLCLAKEMPKNYRKTPLLEDYSLPLIELFGFVKKVRPFGQDPFAVVADDFVEKVLAHLDFEQLLVSEEERFHIEDIVLRMTELYGIVTQKMVKEIVAQQLSMTYEEASTLFDSMRAKSALLEWLCYGGGYETEDTDILYYSPQIWGDIEAFQKEVSQHKNINDYRPFPNKSVNEMEHTANTLNAKYPAFVQYLTTHFDYDEATAYKVCFNLWYRAQHELDKEYEGDTYTDYFVREVVDKACKKLSHKEQDEVLQQLKDYMNNMPRWILKGYSPMEVGSL